MLQIVRTALIITLASALSVPVAAQSTGVWNSDLAALSYPPDTVGGYWDAGYDFDFMLYCSPSNCGLNLGFGSVNTLPSPDHREFFVVLGDQCYAIPWIYQSAEMGFVTGYFPAEPMAEPWPGQAEFIQRLIDGHQLIVMEGAGADDLGATQWAAADPAPGHPIFQALSRTCGSGALTPQTAVAQPPPRAEAPTTWVLGAGTDLWDGLTAFSRSDADHASGFVHCGRNGLAEFVLRVDQVDAPADTNFGGVFLGADVFEIVAGNWGGAYAFDAAPDLIGAMMTGRTMNIDSLIPVYEPVESIVTFPLSGARSILEQAFAPCAATALP